MHEALDGEAVEAVVGEGGDFGLVDAEMAGRRGKKKKQIPRYARNDIVVRVRACSVRRCGLELAYFGVRRFAMRRAYFLTFVVLGMISAAFGQTTSSDSQTLQALLIEVRQLRHDLQVSLAKTQSAQILLARLQIQEVAVTRASQHLDDARSRLAEVRLVLKSYGGEMKHLQEDAPNGGDTPAQVDDAVKRDKSDLEAATDLEQKRQEIESEAELQLRTEQDKLNTLETQLDELVREMGSPDAQPGRVPH